MARGEREFEVFHNRKSFVSSASSAALTDADDKRPTSTGVGDEISESSSALSELN